MVPLITIKTNLLINIIILGQKKYHCQYCGKSYRRHAGLWTHLRKCPLNTAASLGSGPTWANVLSVQRLCCFPGPGDTWGCDNSLQLLHWALDTPEEATFITVASLGPGYTWGSDPSLHLLPWPWIYGTGTWGSGNSSQLLHWALDTPEEVILITSASLGPGHTWGNYI